VSNLIDRYGEVVAQDGVHPNEIGYKVFAEYVGGELARIWKEQAEVAPPHHLLSFITLEPES